MDLGMKMLCKNLLGLDPDQIQPAVEKLKADLPAIIDFVKSIDQRLSHTQQLLLQVHAQQSLLLTAARRSFEPPRPYQEAYANGRDPGAAEPEPGPGAIPSIGDPAD